jgi:hypothetical protein
MLVLVKLGIMSSMSEKYYNTWLQTWIRAPGCIAHALFTLIGYRTQYDFFVQNSYLPEWAILPACLVVGTTFFWNGLYFQERVTTNYGYKLGLIDGAKEAAKKK